MIKTWLIVLALPCQSLVAARPPGVFASQVACLLLPSFNHAMESPAFYPIALAQNLRRSIARSHKMRYSFTHLHLLQCLPEGHLWSSANAPG
jgi:hypothetical protein